MNKLQRAICPECSSVLIPSETENQCWYCPNCGYYSDSSLWDAALERAYGGIRIKIENKDRIHNKHHEYVQ